MKKILFTVCTVVSMAIPLSLTGCNSCSMTMKNLESDYAELDRDVVVRNAFTGDTIFSYSGPCYFKTSEHSNDVSIIYWKNNRRKKADFVGSYVFSAIEK